jgi:protein-S-isoprenylcysteine O-methyltransferase Ste14
MFPLFVSLMLFWLLLEGYVFFFRTVLRKKNFRNDVSLKFFLPLLYASLLVPLFFFIYTGRSCVTAIVTSSADVRHIAGIAIIFSGIILRSLAIFQLRENFSLSIDGSRTGRLITDGIYGKIRHPAYGGSILCYTGYALFIEGITAPFVFIAVLTAHLVRIAHEEKYLKLRFGESYGSYMKQTKRLLPFIFFVPWGISETAHCHK